MKTKVNEVPLVGPRGRKELLDKINELEEKISKIEKEVPKQHVINILSPNTYHNIEDALSALRIDGKTPTLEQLTEANKDWVVTSDGYGYMSITYVSSLGERGVLIYFGGAYGSNYGVYGQIYILVEDDDYRIEVGEM